MNEPERDKIVKCTSGNTLLGPGSIPWEIGNAFSLMLKKKRIPFEDVKKGLKIFRKIPIRYVKINFASALSIANETKMYAYDAYFLEIAKRFNTHLLTLDRKLMKAAKSLDIPVLEI